MAKFDVVIHADSMDDLEDAVAKLYVRFRGAQEFAALGLGVPAAPRSLAGEPEAGGDVADPPPSGRRRGRPPGVAAAARKAAADEAPAEGAVVGEPEDGGSPAAADADLGSDGGVEPGEPAAVEGDAPAAEAPEAEVQEAEGSETPEVERMGVEQAPDEVTLDELRELARKVSEARSFETMKAVFSKHGVAKPGACPEDKRGVVAADLRTLL